MGEAGVVTEPTAAALEVALSDLLDSPKRMAELSRAGLARALQFSWKATASGWLKALRQTVPTPGLGPLEWVPPPGFARLTLQQGLRMPIVRRRSVTEQWRQLGNRS